MRRSSKATSQNSAPDYDDCKRLFRDAIEERQISLIKWTGEPDKVMNAAGNYIKVGPKTPAATFNNNEACIKARKEIGGRITPELTTSEFCVVIFEYLEDLLYCVCLYIITSDRQFI